MGHAKAIIIILGLAPASRLNQLPFYHFGATQRMERRRDSPEEIEGSEDNF